MTRNEYVEKVNGVLAAYTQFAVSQINAALRIIPPLAREISIDIFVDQDGEGFLTVRVGLDGPDLYVLNKAIEQHAEVFETKMTENGLEPPLPLMDSFGEDFSVRDTLTDCAANWIATVWRQIDSSNLQIPVTVQSTEEYGSLLPLRLT